MSLINLINEALDNGRFVAIRTATRQTIVSPKVRASWQKAGYEFFKVGADGTMRMIEGTKRGKPVYVVMLPGGFSVAFSQ